MPTITAIPAQVITDAVYESDSGLRVYKDYSGRGMYGASCFGVVGSQRGLLKFFIELATTPDFYAFDEFDVSGADLAIELADRVSTDNMGFDTIFYFPGYTLAGDVPDDDE